MAVWRRYNLSSGEVSESKPERRKGPAVHKRFVPFLSPQIDRKTARKLGLKRTRKNMTEFNSEKELNRYLAYEKDHGRGTGWRDF